MNTQDNDPQVLPDDDSVEPQPAYTLAPIVVGIGASAGGLEAFEAFFRSLSPQSGMAYVVIQHLAPTHHSILPEILRRYTDIPVEVAENNTLVEPNTIYVIPENVMLGIFHGQLQLLGPTVNMKIRLSVDYFFRSLAVDLHDRAVAIVLSGTGSDGSLGLKAVKEAGGLVMAQDPTTSVYDGMPRSAIATGMVDFILPPTEMPQKLVDYWSQIPTFSSPSIVIQRLKSMSDDLQQILHMIRTQTGHDFSYYKQSTIMRRIERLMAINHIESVSDYVSHLLNDTIAIDVLFHDLLIGVTNFFRDKEVFQTLKDTVIPQLFVDRPADQPIRIWIAACSTGEEAYSIAMLIQEHMTALRTPFRVQIFATDLDTQAVNTARLGEYPANIESDVPEEYLKKYFVPTEHGYKITKGLRDMLVFSPHSVIKDPPFSRLDLISCRNLLIYMEPDLQQRVLSFFHFALNSAGFLLLGSSESLGEADSDFTPIHASHKIFQKAEGSVTPRFKPDIPPLVTPLERGDMTQPAPRPSGTLRTLTETRLLAHWTPTCVIVNHQGHIRYLHGSSRRYLDLSGEPDQLDIIHAVHEGLRLALRSALYRAMIQQRRVEELNIVVDTDDGKQAINIVVEPFPEAPTNEALLAVYFERVKMMARDDNTHDSTEDSTEDEHEQKHHLLLEELNDTRAYLQSTIEELKSSNEEMQSINEELQSLNEELETSQEELKAVNEELMTSNAELEGKVEEVTWVRNDLSNTLNTLETGIILLDDDLLIRRFNPAATKGFKLIASDVGRSIGDIVSEFHYPSFLQDAEKVFETLAPCELDVQTRDGRWYALLLRPYRTVQNAIKGLVVSFNDITSRKQIEASHQKAQLLAENILTMVKQPFLILDPALYVLNANQAFSKLFDVSLEDTVGKHLKRLGEGEWNAPTLISLIEQVFQENTMIQDYEVEEEFPRIGRKKMLLSGRQIQTQEQQPAMVLIALEDVTGYS